MLGKLIVRWAALGVALTGATQLRMAGLPLGPGEVLLALWMAFFAFCLLRGVHFRYSDAFRPLAVFWALSAALLMAGSLVAISSHKLDVATAQHDAIAFAFVALLTSLLGIHLGKTSRDEYYIGLARATFVAISAAGLILLGASLVTNQLGPISLWYHGVRFRGWSENPNQLANFLLPMPFLGWHLLQRTRTVGRKLAYVLAIIVCVLVGLATGSDSVRVAWVGALGAIATWLWFRLVLRGRSKFLYVTHVMIPLVVLVLAVGAGTEIAEYIEKILQGIYQKGDQGATRITVWLNGIDAIRQSPLFGFGPGAHSGFTGPFEGLEAHNTFIDWGTSTGLLGVILLLCLSLWCVFRTLRSGTPALLGVALTIMIDSLFGYSLRQPVYWLLLLLVVTLTAPQTSTRVARDAPAVALRRPHQPLAAPTGLVGKAGRT